MKRLISLVLTIAFALSLCATSSFATGETLTMTPNVTLLKAGDSISIAISVSAVSQARGLEFHLILPPAVFENVAVSGQAASELATAMYADVANQNPSFSVTVTSATGRVNYVASWDNAYDITAQTLLTITADVKSGVTLGSTALNWDGDCGYSNASNTFVSFTKANGSVSIYSYTALPIAVAITAPVKYAAPQESVAGGTGYDGGTITWAPTVSGTFATEQAYTATATLTAAENYKFNDSQEVTVSGADSISYGTRNESSVTFTAMFEATAAQSLTEITVTANPETVAVPTGSTAATVQFSATGKDGTETVPVTPTWSITSPATHTGISIDSSTGVLSVDKTAASNTFDGENHLTVTVQAASDSVSDTQDITVTRSASAVTSVVVGDGDASIEVPADGAGANTSNAFTAVVYDQYGYEMTGQSVTWTIKDSGGSDVTGVSIGSGTGVVSVTNDAKTPITDTTGQALTVTATCGSVSGTDTITVKRAASVATAVTVGGGDASIKVPADGAGANTSTAFTATVYDQYGSAMTGQSIAWSIKNGENTVDGVTVSGGVVTVANTTALKNIVSDTTGVGFTVTATVGTGESAKSDTAAITVKRDTAVYNRIEITRDSTVRASSSAAGTDTLIIPPGDPANTYTYYAAVLDQYGSVMTDGTGGWAGSTTDSSMTGVSFTSGTVNGVKSGTVTIASAASPTDAATLIYNEGVSGSGYIATVTISLSTLTVDWSGVDAAFSPSSQTYGATYASFFTNLPPTGTASDGVNTVDGTFAVVESGIPDVADTTVTVEFTATESPYVGVKLTKTYTITVSPRTLTVTPTSGQQKHYGESDPALTYVSSGNVTGQTPGFTGALSREAGQDVTAGGYSITQGDLVLADNVDFKAANYAISFVTGVKFTITKAEITITTPAPGHTVLANNAENTSTSALKAIANGGSALPTEVAISYSGTTGTIGIVWAEAIQTFSAKGGTYTYVGTVAADDNYANRPTLTATVTVTPVTVQDVKQDASTDLPMAVTAAKADVLAAASLTVIGVPDAAYLTFDNSVEALSGQTIVWNKTLADVQAVANTVTGTSGDKTITLTVQTGTYPVWATAPAAAKTFTITITNKFPVDVTFSTSVDDVTYGTALAAPAAAQADIGNGTDPAGTFTYAYEGTGSTTYASSATAPTHAGTYKVVATLVSDTHSGTGEDAFTIGKKALTNDMITGITPGTNTYTGSAITPAPTVTDAAGPIAASDYTIGWADNTNAGNAAKVVITATTAGNYSGSAEFTFTIDRAELAGTPTIAGTAAVGRVLTANHSYAEGEVTYQWTRGGANIGSATAKTYTLTSADSNQVIAVKVTGANVNYRNTSTITSAGVTVARQAVSGTVAITGGSDPVVEADTLTAVITGMLPAAAQTDATYQWTATSGGVTSDLGTLQTQALTGLDADTVVTVTVTPNANYSGSLTVSVTIGKMPLAATFAITGTDLEAGDVITPTGLINGDAPAADSEAYTLQWMRDGAAISGAAGATYTVTAADLGTTITLKAVGKGNCTGTVLAVGSASVAATAPGAPVITASAGNGQATVSWSAPAANGSPVTGYTLYIKEGSGSYDAGTSFGPDVTSHTYTGLTNGTVYTFKLTATNAATPGTSGASNEATATPRVPSGGGGSSTPQESINISGTGGNVEVNIEITGTSAEIQASNTALGNIFGGGSAPGPVVIDLSSLDAGVNEAVFPHRFVQALEDAVSDEDAAASGLEITLPGGRSIELDRDALRTICAAAGSGEIAMSIKPVTAGSLPSAMRSAISGEDPGAIFEISIRSGGQEISDLGGTAKIKFFVTMGDDVRSAKVYKLYADGTRELVSSTLDLENQEITIERQTLSTYVVIFSDQTEWVNPFADVAEGSWYYDDVRYVYANSLMNGVSTTAFEPAGTTSRAMVATVLWRIAGQPSATASNPFTDVEPGEWYTEAVVWAAEKGIVLGTGDGLFAPTAAVTREQFVTMLYRYAAYKGYDLSAASATDITAFTDHGEIHSYAAAAMAWAYGEGIITGRTATSLAPLGNAQRAEFAAMLHRFVDGSAE